MRLIDADAIPYKRDIAVTERFLKFGAFNGKIVYSVTKEEIDAMPTVDAVPVRHGRWKEDPSGYGFWICSACGFVSEASAANMLYKFCPVCGARNIEGDDRT